MTLNSKKSIFSNRYNDNINNLIPKATCNKCGKKTWNFTTEKGTWTCICCGNLIYYNFGALEQQIDRIMASPSRSKDFVYSEDGSYIKPKKDETLKALHYRGLIK